MTDEPQISNEELHRSHYALRAIENAGASWVYMAPHARFVPDGELAKRYVELAPMVGAVFHDLIEMLLHSRDQLAGQVLTHLATYLSDEAIGAIKERHLLDDWEDREQFHNTDVHRYGEDLDDQLKSFVAGVLWQGIEQIAADWNRQPDNDFYNSIAIRREVDVPDDAA